MIEEQTAASVMVFGGDRRRRGRPRVTPGDSSIISVRIWADHHDALIRKAQEQRVPLADYVRSVLADAAEFRTQK
jgi:predicted HicB family RNase H-like nuclease